VKAVQYFTPEYLEHCRQLSNEERLEYLENFRLLVAETNKPAPCNKLISIKMPEDLLMELKRKALAKGVPYQTLMKQLLRAALIS
jgi:predicted DNA binding CopG/RHH family protein